MNNHLKKIIKIEMPLYEVGFLAFILQEHKKIYEENLLNKEILEKNISNMFLNKIKKLEQFFTDLELMNKRGDKHER